MNGAEYFLLLRIQNGDQDALTEFYALRRKTTFAYILRHVKDFSVAEEVLQDVFLQIWRSAGSYDTQRGVPAAWIATIARSRSLDRLRQLKRDRGTYELKLPVVTNDLNPEELCLNKSIRNVLDKLPKINRDAIELSFFDGLSHTEIAETVGLPLGTVKTRVRRGIELAARRLVQ